MCMNVCVHVHVVRNRKCPRKWRRTVTVRSVPFSKSINLHWRKLVQVRQVRGEQQIERERKEEQQTEKKESRKTAKVEERDSTKKRLLKWSEQKTSG